ncbi:DMT family transporter [Asticcacaulis sp. AND118]|uniref:DMT family transporter n=1 Tax=Asticcacaulis sp. AND118 TaxID=2840468 RepID=UPI001CFFA58D|nr:DMT family transporter [Asticcacaulis sp. AND118]UDF03162.1 DMT family transporter [Asticcacaulis sp. AND118]
MTDKRMIWGIGSGVIAGALWGLVFLTPELAAGFTPLQLSAGRYVAYGLIAAALIAPRWNSVRKRVDAKGWRALIWLSLLGNILYYICLAQAVQSGGVAMTTLIIGLLPVTVAVMGRRDHGSVPLKRLALPLGLGVAGIACTAWGSLSGPSGPDSGAGFGLLCAFGALASWTLYAVENSRWLTRLHTVSSQDWSLLTGLVTGALALILAVPAFVLSPGAHTNGQWGSFIGLMAAVALLCSVIGNAFWNRASRLLPMTLMGQMILFETLFALLYGFLWEGRWPTVSEGVAIALLCASVLTCAAAHRPEKRQ